MNRLLYHQWLRLKDTGTVFLNELQRIFRDPGVLVIFFVATLIYPILYRVIYWKENIEDIPVAVVDLSDSPESRTFLHKWGAAPEVKLAYTCTSMHEAELLLRDQKVHGIIYFPRDFAAQHADPFGQAVISLYCDMSSFLYMKGLYLSANQVMLETMRNVQIDRYEAMGYNEEFAWTLVQAAPYTETALYNAPGGYGGFLIPAVLMLILHQTLMLGICMLAGTARDENDQLFRIPGRPRSYSIFRIVFGRGLAYFLLYYALAMILLLFYARLFNLPHLANPLDIMRFMVPYLLATIFFSMSVSVFVRNRESGMVLLISTSLLFLFLAGISWPKEAMPKPWVYLSYCIPFTWGANGFIHLNSMGATLWTAQADYHALWILAGVYFLIAAALLGITGYLHTEAHERLFHKRMLRNTLRLKRAELKARINTPHNPPKIQPNQ